MPVERDADGKPVRITKITGTAEEKQVLREWIERVAAYDADLVLAALCCDVLARPDRHPEHLPGYAERILAELRRVETAKRSGDARGAAMFAGNAWRLAQEAASRSLVDWAARRLEQQRSFGRRRWVDAQRQLTHEHWRKKADQLRHDHPEKSERWIARRLKADLKLQGSEETVRKQIRKKVGT